MEIMLPHFFLLCKRVNYFFIKTFLKSLYLRFYAFTAVHGVVNYKRLLNQKNTKEPQHNIYAVLAESKELRAWGTGTQIKQELLMRNQQIYKDYLARSKTSELACKFYLSKKSIQRILRIQKYS